MAKKRGVKLCPSCGAENGPRSFRCKNETCDHDFKPGQIPKAAPVAKGVGKGKKQCPSCKNLVGPRSFICKHCQHNFKPGVDPKKYVPVSVRREQECVKDWKALEKGVRIKVLPGSGDHYINEGGDKIYMQDRGVFTIQGKDSRGLIVSGKAGHGYIYMGEPMQSGVCQMIRKEPHNIKVLRASSRP